MKRVLLVLAMASVALAEERDRLGDPLPRGAIARLGTRRLRHEGAVRGIAFVGTTTLETTGADRRRRLWSLAEHGRLLEDQATVTSAMPTSDRARVESLAALTARARGGRFLAALEAGTPRLSIWDGPVEKLRRPVDGDVTALALSADAGLVALGTRSGAVVVLETTVGLERARWHPIVAPVQALAFAPVGSQSMACVHHISTRAHILTLGRADRPASMDPLDVEVDSRESLTAVAFSSSGELVIGTDHGSIRVFEAATRLLRIGRRVGHAGAIEVLEVSEDGSLLASAASDGSIFVSRTRSLVDAVGLPRHASAIEGIAVVSSGAFIASVSEGSEVHVWDGRTGSLETNLGPRVRGSGVAASGDRLTWWSHPGALSAFDATSGVTTRKACPVDRYFRHWKASAPSPDGGRIAGVNEDGIGWFDVDDPSVGGHTGTVRGRPVWSGDGSYLAIFEGRRGVRVQDPGSSRARFEIEFQHEPRSLGLSREARYLAIGTEHGIRIFETDTGELLAGFPGELAAFAFDNSHLATASGRTLRVFDLGRGTEVASFEHDSEVTALALTPDGSRLVAGGRDGTILVFAR